MRPARSTVAFASSLAVPASVALGYWVAGKVCFAIAASSPPGLPVWLPTGLSLAAVLLGGYRVWPGLAVGAFVLGMSLLGDARQSSWEVLVGSALFSSGATGEALFGAWLTNRYANGRKVFQHPLSMIRFVLLTGIATTAAGSVLAAGGLSLAGLTARGITAHAWFTWWIAEVISALLVTPLVLGWIINGRPPPMPMARWIEAAILGVSLLVVAQVVFRVLPGGVENEAPVGFLVIPLLVWTALRFGRRGTAAMTFLIALVATLGTLRGHGPFAVSDPAAALLMLQNFIAVTAVLALMLAADVAQREQTESGLRLSERRYRNLFENNPLPAFVFDLETLRFVALNNAAVALYGYTREQFLALHLGDLLGPEEAATMAGASAEAGAGKPLTRECRHRKQDGALAEIKMSAFTLDFDGRTACLVLCEDVTVRRRTAARAQALSQLGRQLSAAATAREAAQIIVQTADSLLSWDACVLDLLSADGGRFDTVLCIDTIDGQRTEIRPEVDLGPEQIAAVLSRGPRLVLRPVPARFPGDTVPIGDTRRPSASLMFVPLQAEHKPVGLLSIQSYTPNAYTPESLTLLQALADHCGGALERIRAQQDLQAHREEAAREIQRLNVGLEKRVADRTAQLQAINRELETFSFSVSHDLRAPLRAIRGFSDVLLERYAGSLEPRARDFLQRVCSASAQMDKLIEDLLKLSRLGRAELQRREVDLSAMAGAVAADLRQGEPARPAVFEIAPNLHALGDERLLRIVMENLLRNAWKFTGRQPQPRIQFGSVNSPQPGFFVRDNGAGFDMAYVSKLFGVFQRLHSTAEFPGTGIGLATVQRIINRHGGRVWAEGAVNRGATFFFSLPADDDVHI